MSKNQMKTKITVSPRKLKANKNPHFERFCFHQEQEEKEVFPIDFQNEIKSCTYMDEQVLLLFKK